MNSQQKFLPVRNLTSRKSYPRWEESKGLMTTVYSFRTTTMIRKSEWICSRSDNNSRPSKEKCMQRCKSEKYKYITVQIQLHNQITPVHHTICGWIWIWLIRYRQRTTTVNRILQSAKTMFARGELGLKNILDWIQWTEPLPWAKSPFSLRAIFRHIPRCNTNLQLIDIKQYPHPDYLLHCYCERHPLWKKLTIPRSLI